jgi:hypothetical protein
MFAARRPSLAQVDEFEPKAHMEVTMEATWKPHEKPVALKGNVYVSTYGQTKVHSYLSPPDGLMVNTQNGNYAVRTHGRHMRVR